MKFHNLYKKNVRQGDVKTIRFHTIGWVLNDIVLLLDIDLDRKWSSAIFLGRTFNQEMLEPLDLAKYGEDKRWSSIIFVERTFDKETPKPSDLVVHGEYSKT